MSEKPRVVWVEGRREVPGVEVEPYVRLADVLAVFDGVRQGMEYARRVHGLSESQVAEIEAHFNGYGGSPSMRDIEAWGDAAIES